MKYTIESFSETVRDLVQVERPESEVMVNIINKNNGVKLHGLTILNYDSNVAPTLYMENYFEEELSEEQIAEIVQLILKVDASNRAGKVMFDITCFTDYKKVRDNIYFVVINYEKNIEFLKTVVHRRFLDLAVIYKVDVKMQGSNGTGSITIRNEHLKLWGDVTEEELFGEAGSNTPRLVKPEFNKMTEVIGTLIFIQLSRLPEEEREEAIKEMEEADNKMPMYVITNKTKFYGFNVVLNKLFMYSIALRFKRDFYVIASSIHEAIVINAEVTEENSNYFRSMVKEVNRTQLTPEEVLSDNLYIWNINKSCLELVQ